MQSLLATMITSTAYGAWLPGDLRGYVDCGVILPGDPEQLQRARGLMSGSPVLFTEQQREVLFDALVVTCDLYGYRSFAASLESWHVHWLVDHGFEEVPDVVGRLKNAMRKALAIGRIWTEGYDARYCFTPEDVRARRDYINRHAGARQMPAPRHTPGRAGG